jgi:hypothetical protein
MSAARISAKKLTENWPREVDAFRLSERITEESNVRGHRVALPIRSSGFFYSLNA